MVALVYKTKYNNAMAQQAQHVKIDISLSAILKVLAVILGIIFLHKIQNILLILFVVLILVTALSPVVDSLVKQLKIPRWVAVAIIFGGVALALIIMIWLIFPLMFSQIKDLLEQPQVRNIVGGSETNSVLDELRLFYDQIPAFGQNSAGFFSFFSTIFGGIVSMLTVAVLSIYLLLDEDGIRKFIYSILPSEHKEQIVKTLHKIGLKIGAWLRGQLFLGLVIGLLDLVVLLIFGAPYWLTLAIFAGLCELIPYIGPFLSLVTAIFISFTGASAWGFSHVTTAIGVGIGFLLVQQLESHVLVPKVMQKTVGLSPVIIIIAILIGAELFGFVGIMLSIPVAAAISVIVDEWDTIQEIYRDNRRGAEKALDRA